MNPGILLALSVLALTICSFAMGGEEQVIPLEKVPAEHRKIAQELFPEATFSSANTETDDDGTIIYEIQGRTPDGRRVEVDLFENRNLEEYEVEFTEAEVPGAVMRAAMKKGSGDPPHCGHSFMVEPPTLQVDYSKARSGERVLIIVKRTRR